MICFIGLTANYFVTPEKRLEAYSGLGFSLAGAVVYGLTLRNRDGYASRSAADAET